MCGSQPVHESGSEYEIEHQHGHGNRMRHETNEKKMSKEKEKYVQFKLLEVRTFKANNETQDLKGEYVKYVLSPFAN